ncbi:unnamed protein product, partial [marine sediment metagenome]
MKPQQTDILKPQKLKSINSIYNCCGGGEKSLPSFSQNGGEHNSSPIFTFSKQTILEDFEPQLSKLEKLANRIEECPSGAWVYIHCNSCSGQLTNKPFKQVCLSNFCKEKECLKTRARIRSMKLQDYYITSKNLFNFVIGFKSVEKITNEFRIECHKTFMKILKQLQKLYGKFYFISVRDLNKTKDGKIRLHYHVATLPLKDFRKLTASLSLICNQIEG